LSASDWTNSGTASAGSGVAQKNVSESGTSSVAESGSESATSEVTETVYTEVPSGDFE